MSKDYVSKLMSSGKGSHINSPDLKQENNSPDENHEKRIS
jgi:hypothetical protein